MAKKQFKLYLEEDLIDRLTEAGRKYGRGTPQQVVEELIEVYFSLWKEVNTATMRALSRQSKYEAEREYDTAEVKHYGTGSKSKRIA